MSCPQLARIGQLLVPWMMTLEKMLFTRPLFFGGVPYSRVRFACLNPCSGVGSHFEF